MRILFFFAIVLVSAQTHAAALRSMTTLHGPVVHLKDLFDDAGLNADTVLGPGPEPGGRIIVEAAQLNAIARQYEVAWRSVSRADRAVLEWPGRLLRKEDVLEAVRLAVTADGAADDIDIDLPGFTAPVVPVEATTASTVSQMNYDSVTGRFIASLTVTGDGMNPINARIAGRAEHMIEAPVALTRLLPDTILRPEDLHLVRVRTSLLPKEIARSMEQIVGMQLSRPVAADQPLRLAELIRPPLVQRGSMVRIELSAGGLSVTGQAIALDAGVAGERIRVQNTTSHAFLFADVTGPGEVRVAPDAPPALPIAPARFDRGTGHY